MEKPAKKVELTIEEHPPEGFYSRFVNEWLNGSKAIESVFPQHRFTMDALKDSYLFYDKERRAELCDLLLNQYKQVGILPAASVRNIELLREESTFCITTGQQLHIYLGPQFVLYKIWSVMRQAARFSRLYPEYRFVPVFWMAGEDHDTAEIDHVSVFRSKYSWNLQGKHNEPVGRLNTAGLAELTEEIRQNIQGAEADLLQVFSDYYSRNLNMAEATQALLLHFFGHDGLVVLNPDDVSLKKHFSFLAQADLRGADLQNAMADGYESMKLTGFKPAIGKRSTQLFLIEGSKRLRIDREGDDFLLASTDVKMSRDEMLKRLVDRPQDFSPNALLRPLYQQSILPSAGYVCGPSELVYWHQLNEAFTRFKIPVPKLCLRDSFVFNDKATLKQIEKLKIRPETLWQGYEKSAEVLQDFVFGELKLNQRLSEVDRDIQNLLEALHRAGSKDLPPLRKSGEAFLAAAEKQIRAIGSEIRTKSEYAHLFQRLEKLCLQFYNPEKPQERTVFLISFYLKMGNLHYPENYVNRVDEHIFGTLSEV